MKGARPYTHNVRRTLLALLGFVLWLTGSQSGATERREWVQFTDCKYVEQPYNDGDSFHVQCGEHAFVARLYFVDAPEASLRYPERTREQSEYFGVTLDETLRAGRQAVATVRAGLAKPFALWTRWASAGGRSRVSRYYSFVEIDGQDLAALLIQQGLARTKGVIATGPTGIPARLAQDALFTLEHTARQQKRGIWATSTAAPLAQQAQ